jgi:hypothetical protein
MAKSTEQRNPYKGTPPRPWIVVRIAAPDGDVRELNLLADTGNPFALVVAEEYVPGWSFGGGMDVDTNFGVLQAAWFHVAMPELGLDRMIIGYVSDNVATSTRASHPDFDGLAGLPLLRLLEYGGGSDDFWIRKPVC